MENQNGSFVDQVDAARNQQRLDQALQQQNADAVATPEYQIQQSKVKQAQISQGAETSKQLDNPVQSAQAKVALESEKLNQVKNEQLLKRQSEEADAQEPAEEPIPAPQQ